MKANISLSPGKVEYGGRKYSVLDVVTECGVKAFVLFETIAVPPDQDTQEFRQMFGKSPTDLSFDLSDQLEKFLTDAQA